MVAMVADKFTGSLEIEKTEINLSETSRLSAD